MNGMSEGTHQLMRDEILTDVLFLRQFVQPTTRDTARKQFFIRLQDYELSRPLYSRGSDSWDEHLDDLYRSRFLILSPEDEASLGEVTLSYNGRCLLEELVLDAQQRGIVVPVAA